VGTVLILTMKVFNVRYNAQKIIQSALMGAVWNVQKTAIATAGEFLKI